MSHQVCYLLSIPKKTAQVELTQPERDTLRDLLTRFIQENKYQDIAFYTTLQAHLSGEGTHA